MSSGFAYMLRCADGTFYAGSTSDLRKRLYAHNHLKTGARYTRGRRPVKLVYFEVMPSSGAARKRESELKRIDRMAKEDLVNKFDKIRIKEFIQ